MFMNIRNVLERTLQKASPGPGCWAEKGIGGGGMRRKPRGRVQAGPDPGASLQEIFGPVLAVYVYPDEEYKETLRLVDSTTSYGLTGAVFAQDK